MHVWQIILPTLNSILILLCHTALRNIFVTTDMLYRFNIASNVISLFKSTHMYIRYGNSIVANNEICVIIFFYYRLKKLIGFD